MCQYNKYCINLALSATKLPSRERKSRRQQWQVGQFLAVELMMKKSLEFCMSAAQSKEEKRGAEHVYHAFFWPIT